MSWRWDSLQKTVETRVFSKDCVCKSIILLVIWICWFLTVWLFLWNSVTDILQNIQVYSGEKLWIVLWLLPKRSTPLKVHCLFSNLSFFLISQDYIQPKFFEIRPPLLFSFVSPSNSIFFGRGWVLYRLNRLLHIIPVNCWAFPKDNSQVHLLT